MNKVPVGDEGDWSICSAYTMSSMVDAYRFSNPPPKGDQNYSVETSPVEAALGCLELGKLPVYLEADKKIYSKDIQAATTDQGFSAGTYLENTLTGENVLHYLQKNGVCDSHLIKENYQDDSVSNLELIDKLQRYQTTYLRSLRKHDQVRARRKISGCLRTVGLGTDEKTLTNLLSSADPAALLQKLIAGKCSSEHRQKINPDLKYVEVETHLEERLQELLHLGKMTQPVQVGYCANILQENYQYQGITAYDPEKSPLFRMKEDCTQHSGLAIGMRLKDGQCQVLLRNSWGSSCDGYLDEISKNCEPSGIWLDMSVLKRNWIDVGFLKDNSQ